MDSSEIEEKICIVGDAKLHGGMCKILSLIVGKVLEIFPFIEASRPRSKSGIQSLCALHVALDKAKSLLQHCSECSKLYLAITCDSILMKFEKARCSLLDSLTRVENIVPQNIGCQILEIVSELQITVFELDQSEKQIGNDVISLLQKERRGNCSPSCNDELEIFHQAASKLGITSSRAALVERRALKKLIERAHAEDDKRKESIVTYLLHLLRKYSKHFRAETADDTDSQGSAPCSPTVLGSLDDISQTGEVAQAFEKQISSLSSFNSKQSGVIFGNLPIPPEELRCSISFQLMYDPVIISSGQTYERACIEKWFNDGHQTCPKTQQQLPHLCLTPNYCVKGLIASWCEQNGVPLPDGPPESLDANYWRIVLSESETTDTRSTGYRSLCLLKETEIVPFDASGSVQETLEGEMGSFNDSCGQAFEEDELQIYESLLAVLYGGESISRQCEAVEQIRLLLKDDEEARIYMGANGFVEALVQFLKSAIDEGDEKAQEIGAMALFNIAVNNNRNKESLLSFDIIPLLQRMISNPSTQQSATAVILNLSVLDEAKPIIGASHAVPFLVQSLQSDSSQNSSSCKHDALFTLYNLSTHPSNIQPLLDSGIVGALLSLLTSNAQDEEGSAWAEKVLTVFINLASTQAGKREMVLTQGLIANLAMILDTGEPAEQEQVVSCLLILCNGDDCCSHMVLQEGVIPALVSVSVSGSTKGKEKAQKLLKLFREQRQRDPLSFQQEQQEDSSVECAVVPDSKPLCKPRAKKLGRTLSSIWKNRHFSVYQC
ncbi:U-box domain-containing protein 45 [Dendrobium catenatum]|uniref:RING-type E3 ubiquitin transferase n=1 Tax=Dendrobium catenatum TaxID=906689 RepID=A0A2I0W496_9ASPA|nr:U-box domain-containing protein 45 [Dendrobium catenatum]PKU70487.1 U-box domain-containing protein 45 [Dendrobium catenatum]